MFNKLRKKINNKFKDKDFSEIFKKSASGFFISVIGRNLGFVQQIVITNFFGAAALGVFRVCFSILNLVGIFGRFGVDTALSRFTAQFRKRGRQDLVNEMFQISMRLVLPIAIFLCVAVFLLAPILSDYLYHKPYTVYIRLFSFGMLFFILSGIIEEGIRGLKKINAYAWINNVSTQALVVLILLVYVFLTGKENITRAGILIQTIAGFQPGTLQVNNAGSAAMSAFKATPSGNDMIVTSSYVAGLVFTFILGVYYWFKFVPFKKVTNPELSRKELLEVSIPLLSAKYLTTLYTWMVTVILPIYVSNAAVGIFSGASRLTAFATMPLIAVNNITGPKFAEAFGENDEKSIKKTVRLSTRLIFWVSFPIMAIFFLFPKFLLGFYGSEFTTQEAILSFHIINLGQLFNFMTGPVTQLLNMTGRQKVTQFYAGVTAVTSIVLCLILIPFMGILGAAIATSVARTVLNLGCSIYIYRKLGINTIYNPIADIRDIINRRSKKKEKSNE